MMMMSSWEELEYRTRSCSLEGLPTYRKFEASPGFAESLLLKTQGRQTCNGSDDSGVYDASGDDSFFPAEPRKSADSRNNASLKYQATTNPQKQYLDTEYKLCGRPTRVEAYPPCKNTQAWRTKIVFDDLDRLENAFNAYDFEAIFRKVSYKASDKEATEKICSEDSFQKFDCEKIFTKVSDRYKAKTGRETAQAAACKSAQSLPRSICLRRIGNADGSQSSQSDRVARRPNDLPLERQEWSPPRNKGKGVPSTRRQATNNDKPRSKCCTAEVRNDEATTASSRIRDQRPILSTTDEPEPELPGRIRSFSTSGNIIVNRGDAFSYPSRVARVSAAHSCSTLTDEGVGSWASDDSSGCDPPPIHKVLLVGSRGVGKANLTQQFTTSEHIFNLYNSTDDMMETVVSVILNDEESTVRFVKADFSQEAIAEPDVDAYVLVYSVTDPHSFRKACRFAEQVTAAMTRPVAVILVANKADIVLSRVVTETEGKNTAWSLGCKYLEVSAMLNIRVDELLVGILCQIRLNSARPRPNANTPRNAVCCACLPSQPNYKRSLTRIVHRLWRRSYSLEDLLQL